MVMAWKVPAGRAGTTQLRQSCFDETLEALPSTLTGHTQLRTDSAPRQPSALRCNHSSLQPLLSRSTTSRSSPQFTKHDTVNLIDPALLDCRVERRNDRVNVNVGQVSRMPLRSWHSDHNHSRYWVRARIA